MPGIAKPTSVATDDFLTSIFRFVEEGKPVISARLAETLGVSPATAFGTVRRMARDGHIKVSRKKEIALTVAGNKIAEEVIRRHRLAERFLTDVLDLAWHKAYSEAHRLEHGISQEVGDRLVKLLNNPTTCPHGYPIPGSEGYARARHVRSHLKSLHEVPAGTAVTVKRVPEEDEELLQYLEEHNVSPSWTMKVLDVAGFKGTITLEVDQHEIVISTETASKIIVKPN